MTRERVKISVIVPAFNEEKLLSRSLRQIQSASASFRAANWPLETIVCDNNSTDRTAEVARDEGARVVFEPINQISRARNTGAASAVGDWLIFVDADSYPSSDLFGEVAAQIQTGRCVGGGATVRMDQPCGWATVFLHLWNGLSRLAKWAAGSFIFCEAEAFRQLGGFSLQLFVAEEIDFSRRLGALARQTHRRVVILHRHPLLTSARKIKLYSARDYFPLLAQAVCSWGANLKRRDACKPWYDGRR